MNSEPFKYAADVAATSITIGTLLGYLPQIAAGVSIIWGLIRIYETKTVQGWLERWRRGR